MVSSESERHQSYLKTLGNDSGKEGSVCKYRKSIGVDICTYSEYCRYQGGLSFSISLGKVPECTRDKVMRMMKLFKK